MNRISTLLSIFLLLAAELITAQEIQLEIGEVIVESQSILSSIESRKESVSGKLVIPRADLVSFGYATAGDIIKNMPLVYLDSEPGVNRNVSIGGLDREYQAILINGKKPAGGEDSRDMKLDRIPVSMIERIEIQYNSPVSLSTSGIAGTINIILKEEAHSDGHNIHLESNLNTTVPKPGFKAEADGSVNLDRTSIYGGITYNNYERTKETELYDSSSEISGGVHEHILTDVLGANLVLTRNIGDHGKLKLKSFFSLFDEDEFEVADVKRRKDGTLNIRESDTENDKLRYLITSDLVYEYLKKDNAIVAQAGFSNNYEKRHKDQLLEKSDYFEEVKEFEDQDNRSFDIDLRYNRRNLNLGKISNSLNTGLIYSANFRQTDRFNATRPEGYLLWDVVDESYIMDEHIVSAFAELSSVISERFQVLSALNYEYSAGGYETADTSGTHLFSHLSPSLHLKYRFGDKFYLNAGAARHIARPAFMSMVPIEKLKIKKDLIELGNPDLKPSRALAFDLSASYYINSGSYLSATVYYKQVRDMIEMQYSGIDQVTGYNLYQFVNVDKASLYGFYIDSRIDLDPATYSGYTLYASYSYMGSTTKDDFTGGTKRLDDQPAHLVSLKLDYLNTGRKVNLSTGINYNSVRIIAPFRSDENIDISGTHESGYLTLAARLKYFFSNRGSIYLAGDNLLAKPLIIEQGTVIEKYYPGAIIRLGITLSLSRTPKMQ